MRSVVWLGLWRSRRRSGAAGVGRRSRRPRAPPADPAHPTFLVAGGRLRIEVCTDDIIRVAFAEDEAFFARPSLMAAPKRVRRRHGS